MADENEMTLRVFGDSFSDGQVGNLRVVDKKRKSIFHGFQEPPMKRLIDFLSPLSWLFVVIAGSAPLIFILEPSLKEYFVGFVVDTIAYSIFTPLSWKLFQKFYPDTRVYLNGLSDDQVASLSRAERVQLVESFMLYPKRAARHSFFASLIKVLPVQLVIVFYWQHSVSNWTQFALAFASSLTTMTYFYGAMFLEAHFFLSRELARLHEKFDFSDAFRDCRIVGSKRDFEFQEGLALSHILVISMGLQVLTILAHHSEGASAYASKLILVGAMSLMLFGRIWYLGTRFSLGSLDQVISRMTGYRPEENRPTLALSSAYHYAQFFKSFNETTERLRTIEREMSILVFRESDRSRFRALGEISALVAHDLSGPLHVTRYCAQELNEELADHPVYGKYVQMILTNSERANDLILGLRARLRNESSSSLSCHFAEAHHHALNVLKTQFSKTEFDRVQIVLEPEASNLEVGISRVDLIHILDNLYKNSLGNMIVFHVESPELRIRYQDGAILIQDTGTGLSRERFESLTAYQFETPGKIQVGLGLRLTRRLIEVNGGQLQVVEPGSSGQLAGTIMSLKLKTVARAVARAPRMELREEPVYADF